MMKSIRTVINVKLKKIFFLDCLLLVILVMLNIIVRNIKVLQITQYNGVDKIETVNKYGDYIFSITIVSVGLFIIMIFISGLYLRKIFINLINEIERLSKNLDADELFLESNSIQYAEIQVIAQKWNEKLMHMEVDHQNRELYFNTMIHDIKFPLQRLKSSCNIYEKKYGNNPQISKIKLTTTSLEKDIKKFLILDKIEYFDRPNLIEGDLLEELQHVINKACDLNLQVILCNKQSLPHLNIQYDKSMFQKIVDNLIENVYKYSSEKQLKICVTKDRLIFTNPCNNRVGNIFTGERYALAEETGLGSQIIMKYIDILNWDIFSKTEDNRFIVIIRFQKDVHNE